MDQINKAKSISIWIFIVPFVAVNACLIITTQFHSLMEMYYGINGTWGNSANPANGTGSVTSIDSYWMSAVHNALDFVLPAVSVYQGKHMRGFNFGGYCAWTISSGNADANGHGNFEYAPPSGFFALCSKNLAEHG